MSPITSRADMYVKVLLCAACLFFLTLPAFAAASYKVVFKNGQTVEAEAYTLQGRDNNAHVQNGQGVVPQGGGEVDHEQVRKGFALIEAG